MSDGNQYLGNPNLKKANVPQEFTKENIQEYHKCAQSPLYFIENYVQIVSLDEGLVPFHMYDFQRGMVSTMHENRFSIFKTIFTCVPMVMTNNNRVFFTTYILSSTLVFLII